jgi:hypothetical protein
MQKIIDAEKSDLFDVLAYVAYALPPLTRDERAGRAGALRFALLRPEARHQHQYGKQDSSTHDSSLRPLAGSY